MNRLIHQLRSKNARGAKGFSGFNDPRYLKRLLRHKRAIAYARFAGLAVAWAFSYGVVLAALYAMGSIAWLLLTGHAPSDLRQGLGLLFLIFTTLVASELFRARSDAERTERANRRLQKRLHIDD